MEDVDLPRPEALMPIITTMAIDVGGQEQKFDQFRENRMWNKKYQARNIKQ
jgi:hypothetical protein